MSGDVASPKVVEKEDGLAEMCDTFKKKKNVVIQRFLVGVGMRRVGEEDGLAEMCV